MRSKSVSGFWITTVISLLGVDIGLLGGGAVLAQEGGCGTIESDPATYEDPSEFPPLPPVCFGPSGPGTNVCTDNGCILDVLVVYTPAARDAALSDGRTINEVIEEAVAAMNLAFVNSLIPSFVRLVGTAEVDYVEPDGDDLCAIYNSCWIEALDCLSYSSCMPLAHVLRNELKADIVSLFVTHIWGSPVGLTRHWQPNFNVVQWNWAARAQSWIFAHETGHNLRADHQVGIPCTATAGDCHAYIPPGSPWGTIMKREGVGIIQHYSNPDVSYFGVPTGYTGCANNARCIRQYAPLRADDRVSDCNLNGICDAHDIAVGTSLDCEHNGIPDECFYSGLNGTPGDCCLDGTCIPKTELCCLYEGGTFMPHPVSACEDDCNVNGVDDACESPGACCHPYSSDVCIAMPEDCCTARAGTFQGAGTRCGGVHNAVGCESAPLGACCDGGMQCSVTSESSCTSDGGTFGGAGTYCEDCNGNGWPAPCEAPASQEYGACCNGDGACIIATQCSCQGQFHGVGTTCQPVGACCSGSTCAVRAESCCNVAGGVFFAEGTTCDDCNGNGNPDACGEGLDACCVPPGGACVLWTAECCSSVGGILVTGPKGCMPWSCDFMPFGPVPTPGP